MGYLSPSAVRTRGLSYQVCFVWPFALSSKHSLEISSVSRSAAAKKVRATLPFFGPTFAGPFFFASGT